MTHSTGHKQSIRVISTGYKIERDTYHLLPEKTRGKGEPKIILVKCF